jgi:hypothetical protein
MPPYLATELKRASAAIAEVVLVEHSPSPRYEVQTFRADDAFTLCATEELGRLLGVIRDKRDRALFLVAYRHELRAS